MSSQKGNINRTRCQKHHNKTAFVNDLHDTSHRTKKINELDVSGVCFSCKGVIEWRIKYKKYKPLTVPKKCTKCEAKTILFAYHTICSSCAKKNNVCAKCGKSDTDIVSAKPTPQEVLKLSNELSNNMKHLSERERRTLKRNSGKDDSKVDGKLQKSPENDDDSSLDDESDYESDSS